jgi:hypothetical protein
MMKRMEGLPDGRRRTFSWPSKGAVVTDVAWLGDAVSLFRTLMPCPMRVFPNERLAEAKSWVSA